MTAYRKLSIPVLFGVNFLLAILPLLTVYLIGLTIDIYEIRTALTEYPYVFILAMICITVVAFILIRKDRSNYLLLFGFATETLIGTVALLQTI